MDFRLAYRQPEQLLEPVLDRPVGGLVSDVLEHGPTHQPVEMLGQPLVTLWDEGVAAVAAVVHGGSALDALPLAPAVSEDEVERLLVPRRFARAFRSPSPPGQVRTAASGARSAGDLDPAADTQ